MNTAFTFKDGIRNLFLDFHSQQGTTLTPLTQPNDATYNTKSHCKNRLCIKTTD